MRRIVVGAASVLALVQIGRWACGRDARERGREEERAMEPRGPTRVKLGPTRLEYFEGENSLVLFTEFASDRDGPYYIVYVPTPRQWVRTMPEWSRHRREEILAEIKRLTKGERIRWEEGP
jgi:hypothetical protein